MSFLPVAPSAPKRQLEKGKSYVFTIHMYYTFFNKQPSSYGSNVKDGLKARQLAKQPPTLKTLIQKILIELWVYNLTFSILSSLKLNFSATVFCTT